jgi:hypothetical protein
MKNDTKKEVEAGVMEMGGDMGMIKVCILLLKLEKS